MDPIEREPTTIEDRVADRLNRRPPSLRPRSFGDSLYRAMIGPPAKSMAEVAREFGMSRERVRQLIGRGECDV